MQPDNPYRAPQADLLEWAGVQALPGWSARQLRVLGWLALVSVLINTLVVALLFAGALLDAQEAELLFAYTDWLGLVLVLLGCYLLLRFKAFAEARFAARNLSAPVWAVLLVSLLMELADVLFGEQLFAGLDWQTLSYMALLCLMGSCTTWLGIRLLKLEYPYRSLKVMAWLDIVGGLMLASVLLMLLALLPLLGAGVALMGVFFKGAAELRGAAD
ncbi:hypothetical protein I5L51_23375 [Pseudomonas mendocina]|nr:hypothetical protein [Pseudomonas mendocina]MBH3342056.1 hypothetical protein [Pseudomonas mendocina]